jgi:hypothetical protein
VGFLHNWAEKYDTTKGEIVMKNNLSDIGMFKNGVADALLNGRMNEERQSSFYYKQGYDFGLVMWNELDESDNNDEDFSSIREK